MSKNNEALPDISPPYLAWAIYPSGVGAKMVIQFE